MYVFISYLLNISLEYVYFLLSCFYVIEVVKNIERRHVCTGSLAVLNHLPSGSYHIRLTLWTPATDITSSIVNATFHHSVVFPCLLLFLWQFYLANTTINSKTSNPITGETLKDQIHQLPYFTYQRLKVPRKTRFSCSL